MTISFEQDPEPVEEKQVTCFSTCANPFCLDPDSPRIVPTAVDRWQCGYCGTAMAPPYCAGAAYREAWLSYAGSTVTPIGECTGLCDPANPQPFNEGE